MRDEDDGEVATHQEAFEPLDGGDVEVVRRLVEQQEVRLAHEGLAEQNPATLAARERGEGRVGLKLEPADHGLDLRHARPRAAGIADRVAAPRGRRFRRLGACAFRHDVEHTAGSVAGEVLRQHAHAEPGLLVEDDLVRAHGAEEDPQQGRLAGAVSADQPKAFAASMLSSASSKSGGPP